MQVQLQPRRRRRATTWRPILLEAFFIMLGVVLALAADEWRQDRAERRQARAALASIRTEMATNREGIERSVRYHLHLADTLSRLLQRTATQAPGTPPPYPDRRVFSRGFIGPASMLETAWDAANATDALTHMAYDDVLALGHLYEQQRDYEAQAQQVGALLYTRMFNEGFDAVLRNYGNLHTIISTIWYRECQLLVNYTDTFNALGDAAAADTTNLPETCGHVLNR
jgi:hypothetical protein